MSEPDTVPSHVHREMILLPWYVNGTLAEAEKELVDRHLPTCPACRSELDDLSALRMDLGAAYHAQPGPSSRAARTVLETVAREASARGMPRPQAGSSLERVDEWFRSLFLPRWMPTLAVLLLAAQIGLLLWVTMPAPEADLVTPRSLGMPGVGLLVEFQQSATEEQIRSLLKTVQGRIIDGPSIEGTYRIEVPAANEPAVHRKLELLRGRQQVVRSVHLVRP
jgi:anti-sigma factor RsiW